MPDSDYLLLENQDAWWKWLDQNHESSPGVWLQIAKKGSGNKSVSYPEALEVALCYGWIDGQKNKGPEGFWLQRFTPRRARSIWSEVNRAKALDLIRSGRMHAAGFAAIERAKKGGYWEAAYGAISMADVPDDLRIELEKNNKAREFFDSLSSRNRYAILFRLQTAKKPETRAKRLAQFMEMLANGQAVYPQSAKTQRGRQSTT